MDDRAQATPDRFEQTGYAPLTFPRSRRELLPAALEWWHARSEASGVRPAFRLSELGTMADDELSELTPAIVSGCQISVRDGVVWGRPPGSGAPAALLETTAAGLCAFNAMDGRTTLAEIAHAVAAETGWGRERAFAFTRGLFLHLVRLRVCVPTECDG
jgi:hypothetical protein